MGEKLWEEIEFSILNQLYQNNGGMKIEDLKNILVACYGMSEFLLDDIINRLVEKGNCKIEKIIILDGSEKDIIFITSDGMERLTEKKKISAKKILSNKLTYELKCEGYESYSEWLEQNRSELACEAEITRMYACALADTGIVLMYKDNLEEITSHLDVAIKKTKGRTKKYPELLNMIDYAIVMSIYEKLMELIGKENLIEEAKKANKYIETIMPDRHNVVDSFL